MNVCLKNCIRCFTSISLGIFIYLIYVVCVLYYRTKVYKDYTCDKSDNFCLISKFNLITPGDIADSCMLLYYSNFGKYKKLQYKASRYISTSIIMKHSTNIIQYYKNLVPFFSRITNTKLQITSLQNDMSCGIIIYEKQGDFINWHYDMNVYNGRFFTVLIPIYNTSKCCTFQYKYNNQINSLPLNINQGIIFEGENIYHNCTKLCNGEVRIVLSFTYSTDNSSNLLKKTLNYLKSTSFV